MQSEEFLAIALELFGEGWAYELHKRLQINIRTVKRWGSGVRPVPPAVAGMMLFWQGARHDYSIDNGASAGLAHIVSKIRQVGMPADNYREYLLLIADENQFNPVETWITSKPWDGYTRLPDLYATITAG